MSFLLDGSVYENLRRCEAERQERVFLERLRVYAGARRVWVRHRWWEAEVVDECGRVLYRATSAPYANGIDTYLIPETPTLRDLDHFIEGGLT